jgi:hypothetical protein
MQRKIDAAEAGPAMPLTMELKMNALKNHFRMTS